MDGSLYFISLVVVFLLAVVLLVVIAQSPHEVLFTMCVIYACTGPLIWAYRLPKVKVRKSAEPGSP